MQITLGIYMGSVYLMFSEVSKCKYTICALPHLTLNNIQEVQGRTNSKLRLILSNVDASNVNRNALTLCLREECYPRFQSET